MMTPTRSLMRFFVATPEGHFISQIAEDKRFRAWCREFWNLNFGNTRDKFIVWEHPTKADNCMAYIAQYDLERRAPYEEALADILP